MTQKYNNINLGRQSMRFVRNLKDQVAETLALRIMCGEYSQGAMLPREVDLSDELDVSRTVLREALGTLSAKGLTESRSRRGTKVQPRSEWNSLDVEVLEWLRSAISPGEYFGFLNEVRWIVEPNACALAAQRATPEQIEKLEQIVEVMENFRVDPAAAAHADHEFHKEVLLATGNPMLTAMSGLIVEALGESIATSFSDKTFESALPMHAQILDAVRRKDSAAARAKCFELLETTATDLEEALQVVRENTTKGEEKNER